MSRFVKLPENLKSWKIITRLSDDNNNEVYKVSKKDYDGTVVSAKLRYVFLNGDTYNSDNVDFINEEVQFLNNVSSLGDYFSYVDLAVNNNPAKDRIEMFIITEDLQTLSDYIKSKSFSDAEIVDFGIQMSAILERLEANNIFHGNINPENIYVTADGRYKLGGFSDFESKVNDMSFVAPEIYKKENADFTTDIYSLGLIMYYMCNNNTLPFESTDISKDEAIKLRFEGKSVTAPINGNEKLKSVIVIACQPSNENRWKNAGNIKNALTSIKNELPTVTVNNNVIAPENTDFDGNVFEEYEYEEFDITSDDVQNNNTEELPVTETVVTSEIASSEIDNKFEEIETENLQNNDENSLGFEEEEVTEIKSEEPEISDKNNENTVPADVSEDKSEIVKENEIEIDNRVFDNYEVEPKVIDFKQQAKDKDYGDYFEEEKEPEITIKPVDKSNNDTETNENNTDNYDYDVFDTVENTAAINTSKSKKNIIVIAISVLVMLAALGFMAFCIINGISDKTNNKEATKPSTSVVATTKTMETTQPTTVPPTTVEPTTVAAEKQVTLVIGCEYNYAKQYLENEGFVVKIGEYNYSSEFEEGCVISQSPEGYAVAEVGSVVVLDVSLGKLEEETEAPTENTQQNNNSTSNSYIFANSDSTYLSESEVESLSRNDLNLALNEIYARRGRIFQDSTLSAYFKSKSWYNPRYTADEFEKNVTFNIYEQTNLQLIINVQQEKGYR